MKGKLLFLTIVLAVIGLFSILPRHGQLAATITANVEVLMVGGHSYSGTSSDATSRFEVATEQPMTMVVKSYITPLLPKDCRQVREDWIALQKKELSRTQAKTKLSALRTYCPHMDSANHLIKEAERIALAG